MADGETRSFVAWTISFQNLAKVSSVTVENPLKEYGKKEIGENGKFFFELIHNVFVKEEDGRAGTCQVKGRCNRSQKKSKAPHTVTSKIADREGRGNVSVA